MIVFVDMYCGCGGMSTGFHEACQELRLPYREIAINHWLRAIETMRANHPAAITAPPPAGAVPARIFATDSA